MTLEEQNVEKTEYRNASAQPPRFPRLGHSGLGCRGSSYLAGHFGRLEQLPHLGGEDIFAAVLGVEEVAEPALAQAEGGSSSRFCRLALLALKLAPLPIIGAVSFGRSVIRCG